jgi:hypothetical protein
MRTNCPPTGEVFRLRRLIAYKARNTITEVAATLTLIDDERTGVTLNGPKKGLATWSRAQA